MTDINFQLRYRHGVLHLLDRTHIMGILNITPDSFSGGGLQIDTQLAVAQAIQMVEDGADIIDFGGESTRPGAEPVAADEELRRIMPVIESVIDQVAVATSIDTYKSEVAKEALSVGIDIVNDISGLRFDPDMARTIAAYDAACVIMHTTDRPKHMHENPVKGDLVDTILDYIGTGMELAEKNGINTDKIIIDPGIGFGNAWTGDIEIHKKLQQFKKLGRPILFGPSRKSFLGEILNLPSDQRLDGTIASCAVAVMRGANIVRVHDVGAVKRAMMVVDALK